MSRSPALPVSTVFYQKVCNEYRPVWLVVGLNPTIYSSSSSAILMSQLPARSRIGCRRCAYLLSSTPTMVPTSSPVSLTEPKWETYCSTDGTARYNVQMSQEESGSDGHQLIPIFKSCACCLASDRPRIVQEMVNAAVFRSVQNCSTIY